MFGLILGGVLGIAGIIALRLAKHVDVDARTLVRVVGGVAISLGALIGLLNCWHVVPPGHRGIQTTFGNMNMEPLGEGLNFVNPLSSIKDVTIQNRVDSSKFECETSDTQTITIEISYNWRPIPAKLCSIIKDNSKDFASIIIPPAMKECVKAEVSRHKVSEITQRRHEVKVAMQAMATAWLKKYDIDLLEMSVSTIDFSDKYDHAIEEKQVAEQDAQKKVNVLAGIKTDAEMTVVKAKADADSRIENARGLAESVKIAAAGEAESLRVKGEAQAEYNEKVAKSLTDALIQRLYLEKWNGELPNFMNGQDGGKVTFMLPLPAK